MEKPHRKTPKLKQHQSSSAGRSKSSEIAGVGKDHVTSGYDEYLWLLQQRNKLLKRLKAKGDDEVQLEKKEQGFSLYINGANKDHTSLPTSRRTKTADERLSSRHLAHGEIQVDGSDDDTRDATRAKTAPTKLTRKEWKPACIKIKTETGGKLDVRAPGKFTGVYSEDFDGIEEDVDSESEHSASSGEDSEEDSKLGELSLSFNDVHKLRRSLENDSSIRESIRTVLEGSFIESDEDNEVVKSQEMLKVKDLEESEEEIEEELEIGNSSLIDSSILVENIPCLKSSYVISNRGKEGMESGVADVGRKEEEENTIVLSFSGKRTPKRQLSAARRTNILTPERTRTVSKNSQKECVGSNLRSGDESRAKDKPVKTQPSVEKSTISSFESSSFQQTRPLSATRPKKMESSLVLKSQDVLNAVALENQEIDNFRKPSVSSRPETAQTSDSSSSPSVAGSLTDKTIALVTKKVRDMDASQQKQLLNLLGKLDPDAAVQSQVVTSSPGLHGDRTMAFVSPNTSPPQTSSPDRITSTPENTKLPLCENDVLEITFEILSNWGHPSSVGLTEVQFFEDNGSLVNMPKHHIQLSTGAEPSLENLVNGKTKTTSERFMWKTHYSTGSRLELLFQVPCRWNDGDHNVARIKVWNYNKKMKDLSIGVKDMRIFLGGELLWCGVVDKGCGNQIYDYAEVVHVKSRQEDKNKMKEPSPVSDPVIRSETVTLRRSVVEDGGNVGQSGMAVSSVVDRGPVPIISSSRSNESPAEDITSQGEKLDNETTESSASELTLGKPQWLEDIKEKRTCSQMINSPRSPTWLDNRDDQPKANADAEIFLAGDLSLLEQPKVKSRPTSGRRSKHESLSQRASPRPESGRRSSNEQQQQQQHSQELHQQLAQLCLSEGETARETSVTNDPEKLLEESFNSLSQFSRCHQGRLKKIDKDVQGDALDALLIPAQDSSNEQQDSIVDDFIIPELPRGQRLIINIHTTWGDQYYVGLNGVEVFSDAGNPVQVAKISADPSDINILSEYNKDPRIVSNLIDGVYCTRDDLHLWLAPFTPGKNHFITIDFKEVSTLAMIRIWNYNKSRIHSFRGAKDVEIFLDENLIFRGEMARASGELGSSETFGDTILFTMNEVILEAMAAHDQTYEPDLDEDEDYLQTSNNFRRPVTADTGNEEGPLERPFTCPKERKRPTVEPTYPNQLPQETKSIFSDVVSAENISSRKYVGQVLELKFLSTWGDEYYLGLTGMELLGSDGRVIDLSLDMLQACPRDLNDLPEYDDDDRTLDKLVDGTNVTMSDEHMWMIPFSSGADHLLTITLKQPTEVTGLRIWNYNKSPENTYRGVRNILVKLDGKVICDEEGILVRKAPGTCHYNFAQEISFVKPPRKPRKIQAREIVDCCDGEDYELTMKPCGFVFQFQLFGSWGDPYYLGLNGLQFFDENGAVMTLEPKHITAYPDSVNVLEGVKDDVRTPQKLIDNVNDTDDGRHMWLAPIFPGHTNQLYVIFDEPVTVSMIKLWNYRKTPIRGVRQLSVLVDNLLVFNGILPQVPTVTRGILPNMDLPIPHSTILFTDDEVVRRNERPYVINAGGYFENQEVCLMDDKADVPTPTKKTSSNPQADQALRPKTSVTNMARTRK